jgi:tRNA/rRNA methyltransferase
LCTASPSDADETKAIVADRAARKAWPESRDYRVISITTADVEGDLGTQVDRLQKSLTAHR